LATLGAIIGSWVIARLFYAVTTFDQQFSDGVIRLPAYTPQTLKMRISVRANQRGVVMGITNTIADLRQQIHDNLRKQHPEWVLPNGESPMCDAYEARLMDLLALVSGSYYDDRRNGSASEIRSTPRFSLSGWTS